MDKGYFSAEGFNPSARVGSGLPEGPRPAKTTTESEAALEAFHDLLTQRLGLSLCLRKKKSELLQLQSDIKHLEAEYEAQMRALAEVSNRFESAIDINKI